LRLIFCGTPQFAAPSLKYLLAQHDFEIAAVVTQPDRPRGRGQEISFSPVKQAALDAGVPVLQPEKIRAAEVQPRLEALAADAIVIIAYGQIIPARLLNIAKFGWINLHASLLPKYRGAAPIQWAIAKGESVSGLTTMRIDAGMDTGEILLQEEMRIGAAETTPELGARMAEAGAPLVATTLRGLGESSGRGRRGKFMIGCAGLRLGRVRLRRFAGGVVRFGGNRRKASLRRARLERFSVRGFWCGAVRERRCG